MNESMIDGDQGEKSFIKAKAERLVTAFRKLGNDLGSYRGGYMHFPEMEGPDLSEELVPGEHEFWKSLDTQSIDEIFGEAPDPECIV